MAMVKVVELCTFNQKAIEIIALNTSINRANNIRERREKENIYN